MTQRDASPSLIEELAGAVADHVPVDWARARGGALDEEGRGALAQLETLAKIGALHHAVHSASRSTWGPLALREEIGRGAFGVVYRAWDSRLERDVALKLLPEDVAPLAVTALDEGRRLARVRHPGVVAIYGADRCDGVGGIWMELVKGRTLARLVRERGPLAPRTAAAVGIELCRALAAVHAAGLVHRDVKASNVMQEDGGRTVLMDLGVAAEPAHVSAEDPRGTPLYMAPELLGGASASARSDLYALGVLLFHLATGAFPVQGRSVEELREAHRKSGRLGLWPRHVPRGFTRIVDRALAPEAEDRWPSAVSMEQALCAWLAGRHGVARLARGLGLAAIVLCALLVALRPWNPRVTPVAAPPPRGGGEEDVLAAVERLAGLYSASGAYDDARPLYERAVALREKRFGKDHESVAAGLSRLAGTLAATGRTSDARSCFEMALSILRAGGGGPDSLTVTVRRGLAALDDPPAVAVSSAEVTAGALTAAASGDPFVRPLGAGMPARGIAEQVASADGLYAASARLLPAGDPASGGATLRLEVRVSAPSFFYVLEEAAAGAVVIAFPRPGIGESNPLSARLPHQLPLGPSGGGARRLFLASSAPIRELEDALRTARVPQAAAARGGVPLSAATVARLRALDGGESQDARLFPHARALTDHVELVNGLWIRAVTAR